MESMSNGLCCLILHQCGIEVHVSLAPYIHSYIHMYIGVIIAFDLIEMKSLDNIQ